MQMARAILYEKGDQGGNLKHKGKFPLDRCDLTKPRGLLCLSLPRGGSEGGEALWFTCSKARGESEQKIVSVTAVLLQTSLLLP